MSNFNIKPFFSSFKQAIRGSRLLIIIRHTYKQILRNKRFFIVLIYFLLPVLGNFLDFLISPSNLYSGKAYAVYRIHQTLNSTMNDWWLSIFGQMFIILLTSDLIASEFERGTILVLKSRSVSDSDIFFGKLIGVSLIILSLIFPGALVIYIAQASVFAPNDFWWVFWHSLDELIVSTLVLFLIILMIISISFLFSAVFNKSLQATLVSLLFIFSIQFISLIFSLSDSIISKVNFLYYLNLFLDPIFYNLNLTPSSTSIIGSLLGFIVIVILFLTGGFLVFKNKEVH